MNYMIKDKHWEIMTKIVRWGGCVLMAGMVVWGAYTIAMKIKNPPMEPWTSNLHDEVDAEIQLIIE